MHVAPKLDFSGQDKNFVKVLKNCELRINTNNETDSLNLDSTIMLEYNKYQHTF